MSNIFGYDSFSFSGTSSNSSSNSLSFSLADYASIQNGSYKKLLSAYYANEEKESGKTSSSSSNVKDSKQKLNSITEAADNLKSSISTAKSLFKTGTTENGYSYVDYDEDKMYKAIKDFADNYNSLMDAASGAETSSITRAANSMASYTKANKNALEAIGISVDSDNKLTVDEDKFKEASKGRVKSLFGDTGGYAYQVSAKASNISFSTADMAKKVSSNDGKNKNGLSSISTSKDTTKTLGYIEEAAEKAKKSLEVLLESGSKSKFNKVTKTDDKGQSYQDYDKDAIYTAVNDFVKDYNKLMDKTKDSNTSSITQARRTLANYAKSNKSKFSEIGITIDSDDNLVIDKEKFMKADMGKVKSLFQDTNSFGKQAKEQISKIDLNAEKEASKSNTYADNGSYSYNYNSGDWFTSGF